MGPTKEEADFLGSLDSSPALASDYPPSPSLRHKKPRARLNSFGLNTNPYNYSSNLTGPPSPSTLNVVGSISGPGTNLASSLRPHKGESPYPFPPPTFSSSTPPEPGQNPKAGVEGAKLVCLPPISSSRRSGPSESLPSLIPRLPRPSTPPTPPTPSIPSTPPTPSKGTSPRFSLRLPTANWGEHCSGSPNTPSNQSRKGERPVWTTIQGVGVPIYLCNPGFDGE